MSLSDCLTLLTLVMGLSAYIGSVRARMLDRAREDPANKADYVRAAARLMWGDAPLVLSGLLLLLYVVAWYFADVRFELLLNLALIAFLAAAGVLAAFHVCEWCKSRVKLRELDDV